MSRATISIIAAVGRNNRAIGKAGTLLWRISDDLKRFKRLTVGHPIIMGRKTFESIGKALPDRTNIVITRNLDFKEDGVVVTQSLEQAIEIASHTVGSVLYAEILHNAAESVRRGDLLSKALIRNEKYFPVLVTQMVSLGEQTGKLDEMFSRISTFYVREVDNVVASLIELIQPALMVVIGGLVGLLFASILIPIYNLIGTIQ